MNKRLLTFCIASLVPGLCMGFDESAELEWASQATAEYGGALRSELKAAMKSGGTLQAIEVCNTKAPLIDEEVSRANDVNMSRVSVSNRNPANAPNEWQKNVLDSFETRKLAGEDVNSLTWHEVVEAESGPEFRFMKAIPTGKLCLQCHGSNIAPPVAEKLTQLYPEDKATGFKPGDLRGAFVVTRSLNQD